MMNGVINYGQKGKRKPPQFQQLWSKIQKSRKLPGNSCLILEDKVLIFLAASFSEAEFVCL